MLDYYIRLLYYYIYSLANRSPSKLVMTTLTLIGFCSFYHAMHFSAKRGIAIACRPSVRLSVRLSVTLVDQDHIRWKSRKLIARTSSPTASLFVAQRTSTYSEGNIRKFGGD